MDTVNTLDTSEIVMGYFALLMIVFVGFLYIYIALHIWNKNINDKLLTDFKGVIDDKQDDERDS